MKQKRIVLFFLSCILVVTQTCKARGVQQFNAYALSIQSSMLPDKDKAKITKQQMVAESTESLTPRLQLMKTHYKRGEFAAIIALLHNEPKLKQLIMENPEAGLIVVKTMAHQGKNDKAVELLIKLNEKHPTEAEIALLTSQFYEKRNELENALSVINNYLNKSPQLQVNFAFLMFQRQLYSKLGKKEEEIESLEEALRMRPQFAAGWLMFAQLQEKRNQLEGAIKGYSHFLELSTAQNANPFGNLLFNKIEQKLLELLVEQLLKKYPDLNQDKNSICRKKIMELFKEKKYKNALEKLEKHMTDKGYTQKDRLLKVQILGAMNQFKQAAQEIKTWILENPEESLWFETLHLLYYAGLDSRIILDILQEIDAHYPDNLSTKLYLADMLTRNAQFKQAIFYHKKALALTESKELQTSICFQLGFLYYETRQFHKMKPILERGKNLGLAYAPLLNLLAYYYVSKENNLEKAEALMCTVLKQIPDNPHFLDTQALIYYKQEKYVKALALLKKIAEQEPDDPTIIKHLAKTYHKLHMTDQGIACMKHVAALTYDKKKKKKYLQLARNWKKKTYGKKQHTLLCCR